MDEHMSNERKQDILASTWDNDYDAERLQIYGQLCAWLWEVMSLLFHTLTAYRLDDLSAVYLTDKGVLTLYLITVKVIIVCDNNLVQWNHKKNWSWQMIVGPNY